MELDTATRISEAKKFLTENSHEAIATVARMFDLPDSTLRRSINRETHQRVESKASGGQNKILKEHQIEAVHGFIRSLLMSSIPPIKPLIFNAIRSLKVKEDFAFRGPSMRWFQTWWKANGLHTIKTKPLATIRYGAGHVQKIKNWFKRYRSVLKHLNIRRKRNIFNFDEQGVRMSCMKRQDIIMPDDISKFYALSLENRQSMTIFESINAGEEYFIPPMLIIQSHELMKT